MSGAGEMNRANDRYYEAYQRDGKYHMDFYAGGHCILAKEFDSRQKADEMRTDFAGGAWLGLSGEWPPKWDWPER